MVCARCSTMIEPQPAQSTRPEYLFCSSILVLRRLFFRARCTMSQTSCVMRAGWVFSNARHSSLGYSTVIGCTSSFLLEGELRRFPLHTGVFPLWRTGMPPGMEECYTGRHRANGVRSPPDRFRQCSPKRFSTSAQPPHYPSRKNSRVNNRESKSFMFASMPATAWIRERFDWPLSHSSLHRSLRIREPSGSRPPCCIRPEQAPQPDSQNSGSDETERHRSRTPAL